MGKPASIELGPYQLLERIGEGGSGQVYRARGPDGPVAVKLLGPASEMDDAARGRFRREIAALGQIAHPHLVTMIDHGVDPELGPYLVLPLLAGETLRGLCGGKVLCPEAALLLAQPIIQATAALHAAGYVHRDLKPENVIASPDGTVTVIDLGLAWREGMTRHTDTGAAVGSVGYMAPEQVEGGIVDARADVWALGVMIYEWIAGKRPFARARPAEEAAAMLLGTCPRLTAADRRCADDLAELVARCLSVEPSRRPAIAELEAAVTAMIDWTDVPATERAAVIADPVGYQTRIAAFRIRRVERLAREALDAGKPFIALAHCDRGLAYAPDHASLLALVAEAEGATAKAPAAAATSPPVEEIKSSPGPIAVAAPSEPTRKRRARWPWLVAAGLLAWFGAIAVYIIVPDRTPAQPAPGPTLTTTTQTTGMDPKDREMVGDFISLFGRALDKADNKAPPPGATNGQTPTTANGWLELAAHQEPTDAVVSIRHALALSPSWADAQIALCAALAAAKDAGAIAACNVAHERKPENMMVLGARAAAELQTGDAKAAIADLDKVIAADPDPRWRRLRAHARRSIGDTAGAAKDLANACQLGDADACSDKAAP